MPLETLPDMTGRQDADLTDWLAIYFPGVAVRTRDHEPFDGENGWPPGLFPPPGYWIACVESPRFQEECEKHTAKGGKPLPPHWYDLADCPFCHGTGTRQGFHAIVCKGREVAHDPSPEVGGYAWRYNGRLCGITWFEVTDPSRLIPRLRP